MLPPAALDPAARANIYTSTGGPRELRPPPPLVSLATPQHRPSPDIVFGCGPSICMQPSFAWRFLNHVQDASEPLHTNLRHRRLYLEKLGLVGSCDALLEPAFGNGKREGRADFHLDLHISTSRRSIGYPSPATHNARDLSLKSGRPQSYATSASPLVPRIAEQPGGTLIDLAGYQALYVYTHRESSQSHDGPGLLLRLAGGLKGCAGTADTGLKGRAHRFVVVLAVEVHQTLVTYLLQFS
ncbi:hypothetical protein B0H16DRAFT_1726177 [Mycena metata]|uniref:Uncharacterized protein n=1 Tax=Mycena metata TaxID=1033252 RepID=A0AAD7N6Y4_9AGAR|nr:hypothetical protein B0H16DRAFT_1726177 [Mycena metata]